MLLETKIDPKESPAPRRAAAARASPGTPVMIAAVSDACEKPRRRARESGFFLLKLRGCRSRNATSNGAIASIATTRIGAASRAVRTQSPRRRLSNPIVAAVAAAARLTEH